MFSRQAAFFVYNAICGRQTTSPHGVRLPRQISHPKSERYSESGRHKSAAFPASAAQDLLFRQKECLKHLYLAFLTFSLRMLSMTFIQNLVEYYDELYPVNEAVRQFYGNFQDKYPAPLKLLNIACGTGSFEFELAKAGFDVTGLEVASALLDSANLKRRNQMLAVRFFRMSVLEMSKYLGKNFYNVISCLNNRLVFVYERHLLKKIFADCKELLSPGGTFVLHVYNYEQLSGAGKIIIAAKSSIRAKLYTEVVLNKDGQCFLSKNLESGNGHILPVLKDERIYPVRAQEIQAFAKDAGFKTCLLYSDFSGTPFSAVSPELICVIR